MQSLGGVLRERREAMGVTLAEVEVATRIRQKYLSALEADEWHLLPGEVVGRGFLRNYADYLGLDPSEVIERRRAVADQNLAAALSTTSAGAPLPPERMVDYRPKEVDLKDETDDIQRGEIRLTPILAMVALALLIVLGWWGISSLSDPLGDALAGAQTRVAGLFDRPEAVSTPVVAGVVNSQNLPDAEQSTPEAGTPVEPAPPVEAGPDTVVLGGNNAGAGAPPAAGDQGPAVAPSPEQPPVAVIPTATQAEDGAAGTQADSALAGLALPTATPATESAAAESAVPAVEPPTPEPPTPVPPTPTPEVPTPVPTETPTPEPPPPAVAACADSRSVIVAPGVGQVVGGIVPVSGTATHENFQYYKLEYAPGANAAGGFVYFDGSNSQVSGGLLGNLDSGVLPNGDYTIRLTVVDQTGNFPAPCDVSFVVQN